MENTEEIFYKDPSVLYKKYYELLPKTDFSREKQSNIIVRVCIYLIVFLFAINYKQAIFVVISIIGLVTVFYIIHNFDGNGKKKEIERRLNNREQKIEFDMDRYDDFRKFPNYYLEKDGLDDESDDDLYSNESFEAGYLDSNGDPVLGTYNGVNFSRPKIEENNLFSISEREEYEKATCKRPTYDNPFMNHNANDYNKNKENIPKACNVDDDEINDEMELKFNENMFRNIDDVFDIENSKRQFYTLPARQVPNDQKGLAMWCYGTGPTCKEDSYKCLRYEDLRYARRRP
uniref:Minor capsid protein P9 transmembrane helices domain-containing protein n=1 Tax=viral metagenome TaxID=1070528 RepID=A0A6C0ABX8_9ZZZZ